MGTARFSIYKYVFFKDIWKTETKLSFNTRIDCVLKLNNKKWTAKSFNVFASFYLWYLRALEPLKKDHVWGMNFKVSLQFNGFWKIWKPRVIMMHNACLLIFFFHIIMLKLLHFCFIYYVFDFFTAFSFVNIPWLNKFKTVVFFLTF